jgi:hypothetical protein
MISIICSIFLFVLLAKSNSAVDFAQHFRQSSKYRSNTRNFQGYTITEISSSRSAIIFSYIIYRRHLIGSYTPFLLEDVIRKINLMPTMQESTWTKIGSTTGKSIADLQLYVNAQTLPRLLQVFTSEQQNSSFVQLSNFAQFTHVDITSDKENIRLEGISKVKSKDSHADYLTIFTNQSPQPISCFPFIPNTTLYCIIGDLMMDKDLVFL